MCVEGIVTPRQRRWRRGRAFCQRASPSPFSLEDPADTADSYACWTDENADEAAVGWTERVRQEPSFAAWARARRTGRRPSSFVRAFAVRLDTWCRVSNYSSQAMWSAAMDVGGWLRSLGLDQYEANFRENKIHADVLPRLTSDDLKEIGVSAVGDRRRLLDAIASLAGAAPADAARRAPESAQPKSPQLAAERRP